MKGGDLFARKTILKTIGNTPLIKIDQIYAKLETTNPTGSIKDRLAYYLTKKAEEKNKLKPGYNIIETTSGNTGISFAMISAIKGYRFTAIMPESMSQERIQMMRTYGANIILTPGKEHIEGAIKKYRQYIKNKQKIWLPKQFENPRNIEAHQKGIGKEIANEIKKIDAFVAGVGTGGTLIGVAKTLKKINPDVKIIAVEPDESPVISTGKKGKHKIQGIGEGFIPPLIKKNRGYIDQIIRIKSKDAINSSRILARKKGILAGVSSGANFLAAKKIAEKNKKVVTVLPDRGERYFSYINK
ncbi:MAG: cysteine synthase A [Candidatus Thermoplasmatota archaeon]